MVGVVDFEDKGVFFAKQDDNGLYRGSLVAPSRPAPPTSTACG
jgi:hypothetical protein